MSAETLIEKPQLQDEKNLLILWNYCSYLVRINGNLFFEKLAFTHKRVYVEWIISTKKDDTRLARLKIL